MEEWEKLVQSAPTIAHWMGILMVTLSRRDVILPIPTGYPFTVISKTNSLRTAVRAMNAEMSRTFNQIHNDFVRIQLNLEEVPTHVEAIFALMNTSMPADRHKQWLQYALRNIGRLVNETSSMTQTTKIQFNRVSQMHAETSEFLRMALSSLAAGSSDTHLSDLKTQLDDIRTKWIDLRTLFNSIVNSIDSVQQGTLHELIPVSSYALIDGLLVGDEDFQFFLQLLAESSATITSAASMAYVTMSSMDTVFHRWTVWQSESEVQTLLALTQENERLRRIRDFWYKNAQSAIDVARLTQRQQAESSGVKQIVVKR